MDRTTAHRMPIMWPEDLEISQLGDHRWAVCDNRLDPGHPSRVLGYIERRSEGFEVLALTPAPTTRGHYDRWGAAVQVLCG